jgi:hypothetical protein
MIHYGRALVRLSCLHPVVPRFAVLPSCSLASKTALLCERPDECEQRSEPPDRTAEVVNSFVRLSECRRTADDIPDLSRVKTRLGEQLTALSFQQLGKRDLFIAIGRGFIPALSLCIAVASRIENFPCVSGLNKRFGCF